jgi:hypothetical protein
MHFRFIATVSAIAAAGVLSGCSFGGRHESPAGPGDAPVALAPDRGSAQTIAMATDPDALSKAIERFRITKRKKAGSPFEQAGADLNSDGRANALVLFTGEDWCSPQGCTLVVFQPSEVGYKPISRTVGVKAPVAAGPSSNAGWRDLIVKTGTNRMVRLQFTGGGYPVNAARQPEASADFTQAEILIQTQPENQAAVAPMSAFGGGQPPR